MEILEKISKTIEFKGRYNYVGKFLIDTLNFNYQFGRDIVKNEGDYIVVNNTTHFDNLEDEGVTFSAIVRIKFKVEKTLSLKEAFQLLVLANEEMNRLLALEIENKTDLNPITIAPMNEEEILPLLEEARRQAYPS